MFDLIIIISNRAYGKVDINELKEKLKNNNVINGGEGYVVLCKRVAISQEPIHRDNTVKRINDIKEGAGLGDSPQILILSHRKAFKEELPGDQPQKKLNREASGINNAEAWVFNHDSSPIWGHIDEFVNGFSEVNNCKDLDGLVKRLENSYKTEIQISENIKRLSLLKHRIAHLFLSIDVDLQRIKELLSPKDEEEAKKHFQEAFSNEKKLSCRLEKAKKLVNEIKGIVDVDDIQESAQEALDQIERLLTNSDIQELSKIIEDGKGFNEIKKYLAEVKEDKKKSFHDWLCALDDCLERLRDAIKNERGE